MYLTAGDFEMAWGNGDGSPIRRRSTRGRRPAWAVRQRSAQAFLAGADRLTCSVSIGRSTGRSSISQCSTRPPRILPMASIFRAGLPVDLLIKGAPSPSGPGLRAAPERRPRRVPAAGRFPVHPIPTADDRRAWRLTADSPGRCGDRPTDVLRRRGAGATSTDVWAHPSRQAT